MLDDISNFFLTCPKCFKGRGQSKIFTPTNENISIIKQHHNHIFGHHEIDQTLKLLPLNEHRSEGIKSPVVDFIHSCPYVSLNLCFGDGQLISEVCGLFVVSPRLREFYRNLEYHLSSTKVAVTNNQEFAVDYLDEYEMV